MTKMARRINRVCCLDIDISRVRARRSTTRKHSARVRTCRPTTLCIINIININYGMDTATVAERESVINYSYVLLSQLHCELW